MAGVDPLNQFPNSKMAQAVKNGQSQFRSPDAPSIEVGEQNNVGVAAATALTIPATATYCTITAVGGPLYITLDGTAPSAANYAVTLAAGASVSFYGPSMASVKVIGTSMSVLYLR